MILYEWTIIFSQSEEEWKYCPWMQCHAIFCVQSSNDAFSPTTWYYCKLLQALSILVILPGINYSYLADVRGSCSNAHVQCEGYYAISRVHKEESACNSWFSTHRHRNLRRYWKFRIRVLTWMYIYKHWQVLLQCTTISACSLFHTVFYCQSDHTCVW